MNDVEGIDHEIGCALEEARLAWNEAKAEIKHAEAWQAFALESLESRPVKMAARVSEVMAKLEAVHKFLIEAAKLQREKDQQEAA